MYEKWMILGGDGRGKSTMKYLNTVNLLSRNVGEVLLSNRILQMQFKVFFHKYFHQATIIAKEEPEKTFQFRPWPFSRKGCKSFN